MNELVTLSPPVAMPALVAAAGERAGMRFLEFFAANIRNPHTRRAYARAADDASRSPTDKQESRGACAGIVNALRFQNGAASSGPAHCRGRIPNGSGRSYQSSSTKRRTAPSGSTKSSSTATGCTRASIAAVCAADPHRARLDA